MINKSQVRRLIIEVCKELDFDNPTLAEAIIWKESNYDSNAIRDEPAFHDRYMTRTSYAQLIEWNPEVGGKVSGLTEQDMCAHSLGLMQVMGVKFREMGYRGPWLTEVFETPKLGLYYGIKLLQGLLAKYDMNDAISAYNAGSPTPRNAAYVEDILKKYNILKKNGGLKT